MAKAERFVMPGAQPAKNPNLSLNQAATALVALLNGAQQIPAIGQLRAEVRRACRARINTAQGGRRLERLTAAEAVTAIIALINACPRTLGPTKSRPSSPASVHRRSRLPACSRHSLSSEGADVLSALQKRDGADDVRRAEP